MSKAFFICSRDAVVRGVPSGEHLLVLMDADARTGRQEMGWTDRKMVGSYGRDELNDNGALLFLLATDNKLAFLDG